MITNKIHIHFTLLIVVCVFALPVFAAEEVVPDPSSVSEGSAPSTNSTNADSTTVVDPASIPAQAAEPAITTKPESLIEPESVIDPEEEGEPKTPGFVDVSQRVISEKLINMSNSIDAFFSDDRMMEESTGTYGCIRAKVFYEQGGDYTIKGNVCLKVDLPNTKRRWKLFIESKDDEDEEDPGGAGQLALQEAADENTGSTTGLRYVADRDLLKNLSFDIGIKSRLPLDPFSRLRYRQTWTPSSWLLRLTETLYYYKSIEGGMSTRMDFERPLTQTWYSRFTSEADYRDQESQFRLKQVFGIYRKVGKGKALNLELSIRGDTQPNAHLTYYIYRLRYRFNVWRDWFFVEIAPQMLYESETNFENIAGIQLSTEAVFGNF